MSGASTDFVKEPQNWRQGGRPWTCPTERTVSGFQGFSSHCGFSGKLRKHVYNLRPTACWSNRDMQSARTWCNGIQSNQSNPCVGRHARPGKFLLLFFYAASATCVFPCS